MTALILAAGLGTRLRPLSFVRAKPAMPLDGEPLIRRIARWLAAAGAGSLVVNLHHRPETIAAVLGDGSDLGVAVRYSWEQPAVLGSAGGPRLALPLLGASRFVIVNGDTLAAVDLAALGAAHATSGALVTMAVVPHPAPARYGGVLVSGDDEVRGFTGPDPAQPSWHFVGVQIVEARAFESLRPGEPAETVRTLYPALIAAQPGSVRAFRCDVPFQDIGTPADYLAAALAAGRASGRRAPAPGRGVVLGADARVEHSILWDDVSIGARARLTECIVGDGVRIPPDASFARATIVRAADAPAGPGARIEGDLLVTPIA